MNTTTWHMRWAVAFVRNNFAYNTMIILFNETRNVQKDMHMIKMYVYDMCRLSKPKIAI